MTQAFKSVFLLGAGLTKAFLPNAPLLVDNYDLRSLSPKHKHLHHAKRIIDLELRESRTGKINIERLLTRLDGLPYDQSDASLQLGLLKQDVHSLFKERLNKAKSGPSHLEDLSKFAKHCVEKNVTCVTFNYDDVLDKALWDVNPAHQGSTNPYWNPDGGYGFFCRASESCVMDSTLVKDKTSPLLLKLHGSVNWRIKRGSAQPYSVDAIVHDEKWFNPPRRLPIDRESIELHLEPNEFVVPPVLVKAVLSEEPILRIVWDLAFQELSKADEVIFVGYSCPVTDLATTLLLREALLRESVRIEVINKSAKNNDKKRLIEAYRNVFPKIKTSQFRFLDALEWARELVADGQQAASE
jgi:hypothetical protein